MSVPTPPGWQYQTPQYWDSYLPQQDDYDDAQTYIDALKASSEEEGPNSGRYWDPIGQVWRGGRRDDAEIAASEYNSAKYLDPNSSFNAGMASPEMRLAGKIAHNPDLARAGYFAHDEFGNPILDPAILAFMEGELGIGAYERPPGNYGGSDGARPGGRGDDPRAGGRPDELPDAARWGQWWNSGGDGDIDGAVGAPSRGGGAGGVSQGLVPGDPTANPGIPEPVGELPVSGGGGRGASPNERPPGWALEGSNVSTIDPRYPDFILQAIQGRLRNRNNKWGPRPTGLGGY
jgi:hypothetical protein